MHEIRGRTGPTAFAPADLWRPLDETLQLLALRVDALLFEGRAAPVHEELRRVRLLVTEAHHVLRRVIDEMSRVGLEGAPIDEALRLVASEFGRASDACLELRTTGKLDAVPARISDVVARVAREVLMGVERFGRASVVLLSLAVDDRNIVLEVKDDGVDLPQRHSPEWGSTVELSVSAMARLTRSLGGRFRVYAGHPRGLCLQAVLPFELPAVDGAGDGTT